MRKRIYRSFIWLILPCVLIPAVILSMLFHDGAKQHELAIVREHASLMSDLLNSGVSGEFHFSDYSNMSPEATRMTIIAPDGTVLLDSRTSADRMENHADRQEIIQALQNGTGESLRYSDTLRAEMYYYAVKLNDGNILRVSRAVGGLVDYFAVALPVVAAVTILILIIANYAVHRLTERIIAPIRDVNLDNGNIDVYDELAPYITKIDHQKNDIRTNMEELSDRAYTIEAITGNMKEGLILIDSNGLVLIANNSAREVFGENIEQLNIIHICRDESFQNAVKQCIEGKNTELQMERGDKIYTVYFSPVFSGETTRGSVILLHDATERNIAEKQRREFSANVSHELKTPLTTISALSEMIERGMAQDIDIKSFAGRITEQSGRLLVLIDDIIRLSEFDEGRANKDNTVFDLWELAESVINALRDNTENVEIELTGERFKISANHRMIDELLFNLIDNGVKYNSYNGKVTVELTRDDNGMCKIVVSDTGIGIPEQNQPHVFERFYRVDKSRSKKTGGTGLGLSIVKHITEYYNGSLELTSTEGEGTTVTCCLGIRD